MKKIVFIVLLATKITVAQTDFTIAFGSCNKQTEDNIFWNDVLTLKPDVWVWGGDNIYADTNDMKKMKQDYELQKQQKGYANIEKNIEILATWDDHDYGKNDAGYEYEKKKESQQLFLDFLNVDKNSPRRTQEGIYHAKEFKTEKGTVKIIVLDTRYFRTELTKGKNGKRYQPNPYNKGTILGKTQWRWLKNELTNSKANFNVIVSSIQVLASEHGFEKWANFPHETIKLLQLIKNSKANNVILLSGDRHISEFSKTMIENVNYPIIDFTSSGLTHSYTKFKGEPNIFRDGNVISTKSFGVLKFNFTHKKVTFQMRGANNVILQEITEVYP